LTKLSIITVTYNSADTLANCIESVKAQSQTAEHIIVDGASTDTTSTILDDYKEHLAKVISEPDCGMYDGLNKGLNLATGDIVGLLHADDFYPNATILSQVIDVFKNPDVDACYGDLIYVENKDISKIIRYWKSGNYNPKKFYNGWMPPHPTFFVRRSVYEKFGCFNLDMGTAADYELMLRFLLKHKIKMAYIPEVLVHMRTGGVSNRSFKNRINANRMDRNAWKINGLQPYPWTLIAKPLRKLGQWIV
jgi:glycosyltransferase involved in cell wall biosynthesis